MASKLLPTYYENNLIINIGIILFDNGFLHVLFSPNTLIPLPVLLSKCWEKTTKDMNKSVNQ